MTLIETADALQDLLRCPAAVAFVHFAWSGQSFQSLRAFEELERTARTHAEFFRFDPEDHPTLWNWLFERARPEDIDLSGRGFGSVVWMKSGKVVDFVRFGAQAGLMDLLRRIEIAFA